MTEFLFRLWHRIRRGHPYFTTHAGAFSPAKPCFRCVRLSEERRVDVAEIVNARIAKRFPDLDAVAVAAIALDIAAELRAPLPEVRPETPEAGIDAAWKRAEAALPERLDERSLSVWWDNRKPAGWWAACTHRFDPLRPTPLIVKGHPTKEAALDALAVRLSEEARHGT